MGVPQRNLARGRSEEPFLLIQVVRGGRLVARVWRCAMPYSLKLHRTSQEDAGYVTGFAFPAERTLNVTTKARGRQSLSSHY